MNLPQEYATKDSLFYILPIEYENNPTYGKAASKGPEEIIKASKHLEYYDEQFDNEPFEKGIFVMNKLSLNSIEPEETMQKISETVSKVKNKFLISLGGDHAITIGTVKGLEENFKDFSVIILDAHSDFRYSWNNSQFNHASVSRRMVNNHKIGIIGVRSQDIDEAKEIQENENVQIIKAYEYDKTKLKDMLNKLHQNIYISIDTDVFDPSFIRNTGTPEPGGLFWNQLIDMLKIIFKNKNVIGADIVEFSPRNNFEAESFSLAKLCYKLMALHILYSK